MDNKMLVEEYKSLRVELLQRENTRYIVLAFTITAIGSSMGAALVERSANIHGIDNRLFFMTIFAFLLIISALMLTRSLTQKIDLIANYIRVFIEEEINEIRWESYFLGFRESKRVKKSNNNLPMGISKTLALYYVFLTLLVYISALIAGLYQYGYALAILSALGCLSLWFSFDLYFRRTKGWEIDWTYNKDIFNNHHNNLGGGTVERDR